MQEDWVLPIRDQCQAAQVPFFFKQWGGVQKAKAGRSLAGRTYDEMPIRITQTVPPIHVRRKLQVRWAASASAGSCAIA
jgi:hypothetical protein